MVTNRRNLIARVAAAAVLSGVLSLIAVPRTHADDDRSRCQQRMEKAEAKLDAAVRHHGEHSQQAADRRRDLVAEREHCWNEFHLWWNGVDRRWHEDRDWDRDDHDRDHDHDHDH